MNEGEQIAEAPAPAPSPRRAWDPANLFTAAHLQRMAAELVIVVVGVVLGMAVTNWNEDRREHIEVERLLDQFQPELAYSIRADREIAAYYGVTRHYAETALAGWANDPKISDRDFVIAAYQASQIAGTAVDDGTRAAIFGGAELRQIDDLELRQALARALTQSTASLDWTQLATPYRTNVRRLIPVAIQDAIRAKCGDRPTAGQAASTLPETCDPMLPAEGYVAAAAALRAHPGLVEDLRWHLAEVATYLANLDRRQQVLETLSRRMAEHRGK